MAYLPVSVLKPLKGADNGLEENFESFFLLDYPEFELIFSVADGRDPGAAIVRKLLAKYPNVNARLIEGDVDVGPNPKVNNMVRSYSSAKHPLILISDSNIRVDRSYLKDGVNLLQPGVGLVTATVSGHIPEGLGGELEAIYLNTFFGRGMIIAAAFGHTTVMGKSMLFSRETAERFGGIYSLSQFFNEDHMSGQAMDQLNLKTKIMHQPVKQVIGPYKVSTFWKRHIRWGRMRKVLAPFVFIFEPLHYTIPSAIMGAIGLKILFGVSPWLYIPLHITWFFIGDFIVMSLLKTRMSAMTPIYWLMRETLAVPLWAHTLAGNTIDWRGNKLKLAADGTIEDPKVAAAKEAARKETSNETKDTLMKLSVVAAFLIMVLGAAAKSSHAAGLSAEEILKKSIQGVYSGSETSTYLMKLVGGGSESIRKMTVAFKRGDAESAKLVIKFQDPADIRGTGLLSVIEKGKPADQWIYLPAVKKTRRIKGGNENESFLGSDFTVGDLTNIDNDQKRFDYSILENDRACGAFHCYVLIGKPKAGTEPGSIPYTKKIMEVRKDNFMTTRIEFHNLDNKLEKVLELKGIHQDNGKSWVADRMEMKNLIAEHSTVIEVQKRDTSKAPSDALFTQSALERN